MSQGVKMKHRQSQGFTIIELVLSMSFVAVLLLSIAMTIIQIGNIYNKGTTVKETNQAGRAVVNDLLRTFTESQSVDMSQSLKQLSAGGRLCLGKYSYVWNTAAALQPASGAPTDPTLTGYASSGGVSDTRQVHFVKVADANKAYCALTSSGNEFLLKNIREADKANAQELLAVGDHTLNMTRFSIPDSTIIQDTATNQVLYTVNFTIGSGKVTAMNPTYTECLPPSNLLSDITYCNVQSFSVLVRVGGGVKNAG